VIVSKFERAGAPFKAKALQPSKEASITNLENYPGQKNLLTVEFSRHGFWNKILSRKARSQKNELDLSPLMVDHGQQNTAPYVVLPAAGTEQVTI